MDVPLILTNNTLLIQLNTITNNIIKVLKIKDKRNKLQTWFLTRFDKSTSTPQVPNRTWELYSFTNSSQRIQMSLDESIPSFFTPLKDVLSTRFFLGDNTSPISRVFF
jgi:hypothetical protein